MAKRKYWTQDELARAKPYLKERLAGVANPVEFNVFLNSELVEEMLAKLSDVDDSTTMNRWADDYLSEAGWSKLLNFLRVSKHRAEEQAKEQADSEAHDEEKDQRKARKAALAYVSRLDAEELVEFLKAADEKQKRRARRERQERKEKARADQQRREREQNRNYREFGQAGSDETYTVKECRIEMQKHHPDKGGNSDEFQVWKERCDRAKVRAKMAA